MATTEPMKQAIDRVRFQFAQDLAQEIRIVDGDHSLSASALADALLPFIESRGPVPARPEVEGLRAALEADAADLWKTTNAISNVIQARRWVTEGRGAYEWDDDRYKEEAHHAFNEVLAIIDQVQPPASNRFLQAMADPAALLAPPHSPGEGADAWGTIDLWRVITNFEKIKLLAGSDSDREFASQYYRPLYAAPTSPSNPETRA